MVFSVDKKIKIGLFSAVIILLISYFLFFFTTDKVFKNSLAENKRNEIIVKESNLLSTLKDMETVFRGFLLINNKESLDLYYDGIKKVEKISNNLKTFLESDSIQLTKLSAVDSSIKTEIKFMQDGIDTYVNGGHVLTDTVKNLAFLGKQEMDNIRRQINEMQITQYQLNALTPVFFYTSDALKIINVIALILFILIIIYCFNVYSNDINHRKIAAQQSFNDREALEQKMQVLAGENDQLAQQETIEKFAATGRMARMIAHEVRNPLTNIGLANDQLKDVVEINEESAMLMNMIKRNGERINLLIGDLLTATKFGELNCEKVSVNALLDDVLLSVNSNLEKNFIIVKKNYAADLCDVIADPDKIKIVFVNVILNGIEAINSKQGLIQLTTAINDQQCIIEIRDNGIGIEEGSLPKLFEPFFTSKNKSNGLGLTNAQNIVLNHSGKIRVESIPGKGSCFTISLPCTNNN